MNRYDVASVLAEGGQGRVYRATDRITGQACVLKTGETVRGEALLSLQLSHPYIARPFDAGIDSQLGQYAAYPEYTETPLLEWSRASGPAELQRVALQIAEFLAFLHRRGWLYHDFKPEHFLVARQSIRVLDLGLAQPIQETSQTFSGTFPYIAPERLAGRKCDARSDIFALGMLLLHVLQPDETWDFEPSVEVLQNLQKRTRKLPGFWKDLLSEMISLEPAQRIESAAELWKRLLPSNARGSFLFFPMPAYFTISENILQKQIVTVQSASNLNISEVEKITLQESWKKGIFTASFDLRHKTPEDVFRTICWTQLNQQPADLFSAIESLQKAAKLEPFTIVLRNAEGLNSSQRSLLAYGLSALQSVSSLHFVFLGSKQVVEVPDESSTKVDIPVLTKQTLNDVLLQAFPLESVKQERLEKAKAHGYSLPDQLLADLRKQLPQEALLLWPAAARDLAPAAALERLRATEMRILGSLAIASLPLPKDWLFQSLRLTESQGMEWLESLQVRGYLHLQDDLVSIVINPRSVLERLRKDRVRQTASALLSNAPLNADPEILYGFAKASHNKSNATLQALRIASTLPERSDAAQEWYWKAFLAGAELPKKNLFNFVKFSMRAGKHTRTKAVLNSIRKRFGKSFKLAHLWLDFHLRASDFAAGEKFAGKMASIAKRRNNDLQSSFFQARQTVFMIRGNNYENADPILDRLRKDPLTKTNKNLSALIYNYKGLSSFHKGKFDEALKLFKRATRGKLPELSNAYMNVGIVFGRLGQLDQAEKWLLKAVRRFQQQNDSDRLSFAFGNLGILLKQKGKTAEARACYFKSLQLNRIYKNVNGATMALINLSGSYEIEGRLGKALRYAQRTILLARRAKLTRQIAYGLTHAGRIYAILGKYKLSIEALKEALELRLELKHTAELAVTYETLGLSYLFSGHTREALIQFSNASALFEKANAQLDQKRITLFTALITKDNTLLDKADVALPENSFESGFYHYVAAHLMVEAKSENDSEISAHLHEAERIFRNVPSLFWLGRVLKTRAEHNIKRDHFEKAGIQLESAYNIFSRLGATKELLGLNQMNMDIKSSSELLSTMAERLPYKVLTMVKDVLAEQNPDKMIERILSSSIEFTDMERAVLILAEDPPRIFKTVTLDESTEQEIYEISQSALEEATDSRKPYIRLNAVSDPYLKAKPSILASRIMSIVCLPLRAGDRYTGVLYLDSREGIETLAKTETVLLEIFASIIGIALSNSMVLEQSLAENESLRASLGLVHFPEIIGKSESILKVLKTVQNLLETDLPVLITGETGTGKELIARVLHFSGKRKNGPFLAVNCSALTKTLLESELFGHEKGSFTGAIQQKKGLFEQAKHGTLFLDEVGEMPPSMQVKLLRVLQEGEFRRVGGTETLLTDARVILATNRNLQEMIRQEKFREDLYYRIKGAQIHVPSLRERQQDILLLAAHFLKTAAAAARKKISGFSQEATELMRNYGWPGNVRQLKNEVERLVAFAQTEWIKPEDLDAEIRESDRPAAPQKGTLKEREKRIILEALKDHSWNILQTARSLGLTRNGLYGKMKLHGIAPKSDLRK